MTTATLELTRSRFQIVHDEEAPRSPGANRLKAHGWPADDRPRLKTAALDPIRIAWRRRDLVAAFSLVYSAYLRTGLMRPNPYQMRITPFQLLPTTDVFVASAGERPDVVCTMSLVGDGRLGLPMESLFADEVSERRRLGISMGEVSCLADIQDVQAVGPSPLLKVMSFMAQRAQRKGIEELLITVHPHHVKFYERLMGFERIGKERAYDCVLGLPAVPLALNLVEARVKHPRAWERFFGHAFPADALCDQPITESVKAEFHQILAACSPPVDPENLGKAA